MSLTRAFSYAGCQNTIASLWRADDVSSSKISGHLHKYIDDGKTYAASLQQAKIDYLNEVPERLGSPAYWAHLRLIGTFEMGAGHNLTYLVVIIAVMLLIAGVIYLSRRRS